MEAVVVASRPNLGDDFSTVLRAQVRPDRLAVDLGIGHFGSACARFIEQSPHAILISLAGPEQKIAIFLRGALFAKASQAEFLC